MYKRLEAVGSRLLGLFVPEIEAAATEQWCAWGQWARCWQCNNGPCQAYCCNSWSNCPTVNCL